MCLDRVARQRHRVANVHVVVRSDGNRSVTWRTLHFVATEKDLLLSLSW